MGKVLGGLFGGSPKMKDMGKPPEPLQTPVETSETSDQMKRRIANKSGYGKTIVTGNLAPSMGKKTTFG